MADDFGIEMRGNILSATLNYVDNHHNTMINSLVCSLT